MSEKRYIGIFIRLNGLILVPIEAWDKVRAHKLLSCQYNEVPKMILSEREAKEIGKKLHKFYGVNDTLHSYIPLMNP